MKNRTLYEIHGDLAGVLALIDEAEGEIGPELEEHLDRCQLAFELKLGNCCAVIKNYAAEADKYDAEIKRLKRERDRCAHVAERVRAYVQGHVVEGHAYDLTPHKIAWRKSEAVELADDIDISEVPDAYKDTITTLRKAEVKRDLKMGADLWFVKVVEKQNLQIK